MAPTASTSINVRLTEPFVLLVGGPEHERARARRRRALRLQQQQLAAASAAAATTAVEGSSSTTAATGAHHDSTGLIDVMHVGTSDVRRTASPFNSPPSSRPGSRAASPAPARSRGRTTQSHAIAASTSTSTTSAPSASSPDFVPPPSRGRSGARSRSAGGSRTRSLSRQPASTATDLPSTSEAESGRIATGQANGSAIATPDDVDEPPPAMLRGLVSFTLSKPSRIREISVRLKGIARTEWPEGIGPRRMDTFEETVLTSITHTFFSASHSSMDRRAASVGPAYSERAESRGRPARRAASMLPQRDLSRGRVFALHHEATQSTEDGLTDVAEGGTRFANRSTLSRIASSSSVEHLMSERDAPPPVLPGEQAPAYEVVDSRPSSPMRLSPRRTRSPPRPLSSPEPVDLARAIRNATRSPRGDRSPGSPLSSAHVDLRQSSRTRQSTLSPLASSASLLPGLGRTSTNSSQASRESSSSDAHDPPVSGNHDSRDLSLASSGASQNSTDTEAPRDGWSSAPVLNTAATSLATQPQAVESQRTASEFAGAAFQPRTSTRNPSQSTATGTTNGARSAAATTNSDSSRRPSSSSNTNIGSPPPPSAMRNPSSSSSSVRTGTSKTRFSLTGLTDALRGKSASRARESSTVKGSSSTSRPPIDRLRREQSPDRQTDAPYARDHSRGRKTALKVLREALTSTKDAVKVGDHGHGHDTDEEDDRSTGWKEFRAGTYTYPISIAVPASLPPTINADFGHVTYTLKATVHRAGALTSNLSASTEVILVSAPSQDDTEENESIVVERFWETQMKYHVALSGKSFPVGGTIPISIRLSPMAKVKLYRVTAVLEQKTNYYATGRKLTRHETPKKYTLLRVENKDPKDPLLPIFEPDANAIMDHPLREFFINPTSSEDWTPQLLDPLGPWYLESNLQLPDCTTKVNFSTAHEKSNISTSHILKIMLRVERGDDEFLDSKGKRKLWDVIIESPLHLLSCRVAQNSLPAYTDAQPTLTSSNVACETHQPSHHSRGLHLHLGSLGSHSKQHGSSSRPGSSNAETTGSSSTFNNGFDPHHESHQQSSHASSRTTVNTSNHIEPPTLTIEQNLQFARLVAGQESPAGEQPPDYNRALNDSTSPPIVGSSASRQRSVGPFESESRTSSRASSRVRSRGRTMRGVENDEVVDDRSSSQGTVMNAGRYD
ncbi:hypothetical protein OIO90_001950 [Microbotryomycetes sp. JL221]|nr:hypothetical protein OIO90_001950 [Microbotryomycetes sp. JL221]